MASAPWSLSPHIPYPVTRELQRGIRILSDHNAKNIYGHHDLCFLSPAPRCLFWIWVLSPLAAYITNFFNISLWMGAATEEQWPHWWSIFYWATWMAYAPIVGLFLARLVRGRTIRQFIAVNLVAPALFGMVWFTIFGGSAIHMQLTKAFDLWATISDKGVEYTVFSFFQQFPLSSIIIPIFLITVVISFVTLADSMTTCVAAMSTKGMTAGDSEAPAFLKIIWGVVMGLLAYIMISTSGVDGVKMIGTIAGLPIMALMIGLMVSTLKATFWKDAEWSFGKKDNEVGLIRTETADQM